MAQVTGTLDTYSAKRQAEDVRDVLYTIAVKDKPFLATVSKTDAVKAKLHEWQTDVLRTPADNAQVEGDDVAFTSPTQPVDAKNYCQISREQIIVSGTTEAVKLYGRKSELKRQIAKKSEELARDIERAIVGVNQASVAGNSSTARRSASLAAWLTTNVSRGAAGANGGYQTGTGLVNAATNGTQRAFTEALYKTVVQSCHQQGSMPKIAMMSPKDKVTFSSFTGIAVNRVDYDGDKGHAQASADPGWRGRLHGRLRQAGDCLQSVHVHCSWWPAARLLPDRSELCRGRLPASHAACQAREDGRRGEGVHGLRVDARGQE
jgi:hypothetical protein